MAHTTKTQRTWLACMARAASRRLQAATALLVLEGASAILFAGALAAGIGTLQRGQAAAAVPWAALALAAAAARGACGWAAAQFGATASAQARTALRRQSFIACLAQPPGTPQLSHGATSLAIDAVEQMDGYLAHFLPAQRAAGPISLLVLLAAACASPVADQVIHLEGHP